MKPIIKIIFRSVFPFASVWITLLYIYLMNIVNLSKQLPFYLMIFTFIPVLMFDYLSLAILKKKKTSKITLTVNSMFWFVIFSFWVLLMPYFEETRTWLDFFYFSLIANLKLIYTAEYYFTYAALILWLLLYYIITVRKNRFRILTSLFLPGILTYILFFHFYFLGGFGAISERKIDSQKGVKIFYSKDDFPKQDYFQYKMWTQINMLHSRDIFFDKQENALYANYANTYGKISAKRSPNLIKVDIDTKKTIYTSGFYTRSIALTPAGILGSPWYEKKIYEFSKKDLSIIRTFSAQADISTWETAEIFFNESNDSIYVSNDLLAALFRYDYNTGSLLKDKRYDDFNYGGGLWNFQASNRTGMLYAIGLGKKESLFELDPVTLEINRSLDLDSYGGSALLLDDDNGLLYFQDGNSSRLFEIDITELKVLRIFKSHPFSRKIYKDKKRDTLYILSYLYGRLFAIDLNTGKQLWTIKVGGKPSGLAVTEDLAYVISRTGILRIELDKLF
ncbi:YncE family protein [Elusimicrobiota bacterium]